MTCRSCESAALTPLWTDADNCRWARCRACGCDTNVDADYAHDDYDSLYVAKLRRDEQGHAFENHEHNGDAYHRHGVKPGRFLDVGCGHGASGDVMYSFGWDVTNWDVSREGRPPDTVVSRTFRADLFPAPFDAVLAREVLEHVADPRALLREMHQALKRGGLCQLTTPRPIDDGARWQVYQRYHMLIWHPDTLKAWLRANGWQVMQFEPWELGQRYMLRRL